MRIRAGAACRKIHRSLSLVLALPLVLILALPVAGQAAPCRQALAMGLDVSGSVDAAEYRLQLDGVAAALQDARVVDLLLSMPHAPVRLAVYEWSAPRDQRVILPWTEITNSADLTRVAARLASTERAPFGPSTALGMGMVFGAELLQSQRDCWKRSLDISGDGRSNTGPRPQDVRARPALDGITLNALVIGVDDTESGGLDNYFSTLVIQGPDAFTEIAAGFHAYEQAMVKKLLRELEGLMLSQLDITN